MLLEWTGVSVFCPSCNGLVNVVRKVIRINRAPMHGRGLLGDYQEPIFCELVYEEHEATTGTRCPSSGQTPSDERRVEIEDTLEYGAGFVFTFPAAEDPYP